MNQSRIRRGTSDGRLCPLPAGLSARCRVPCPTGGCSSTCSSTCIVRTPRHAVKKFAASLREKAQTAISHAVYLFSQRRPSVGKHENRSNCPRGCDHLTPGNDKRSPTPPSQVGAFCHFFATRLLQSDNKHAYYSTCLDRAGSLARVFSSGLWSSLFEP